MTGMDLGLVLGDLLLDFGLDDSTLKLDLGFLPLFLVNE